MSVERELENASVRAGRSTAAPASRYLAALLCGVVVAFASLCAVYGGLYLAGHLPPPPLSNSLCIDEKLVFLRNNPRSDPNFLVIGSSVAWRSFDSSIIVREVPGVRPLNGGFCGLQINQSEFVGNWLMHRWPSIGRVVMLASPLDFTDCSGSAQVFDPADARKFVFGRSPTWLFYLRYFDPVSMIRNIKRQIRDRAHQRELGFVNGFNQYGDGPLDTTRNRGLFYERAPELDPACFDALRSVATELRAEGRPFMMVTTPLHPEWKERYDPNGVIIGRISRGIKAALDGTGARLWDAAREDEFGASAFTDAIHIRWSAAGPFTEQVVDRLLR